MASAATLAERLLSNTPPHYTFGFTPFLQQTYQHSLPADRPVCKAHASGHCPLGTRCTERHISNPSSGGKESHSYNSTVCKHWLRGLCKKGENCEFLHEYNLRKMPECSFFTKHGYCSNGDECMYLHIDPMSKLPPCPHYEKGFCPLGPRCAKRHLRRKMCLYYLAGFCPDGRKNCKEGAHPRWEKDLEKPMVKEERRALVDGQMGDGRDDDDERDRHRDRDRSRDRDGGGRYDRGGRRDFRGGRGGFRGRGGHRFRGRGH